MADVRTEELRLGWGGVDRTALAVVPEAVEGADGLDLLLVFHGSAQTGRAIRRMAPHFDRAAAEGRAVVIYPDGVSHHWNDARVEIDFATRTRGTDDVGFAEALVAEARSRWRVRRVLAAGFSNGAQFVIRLALEMPDALAGIALLGGTVPVPANLAPTVMRPGSVPVILFHGTADPIVPYGGGVASIHGLRPRGEHLSAPETAAYWARRNGITTPPVTVAVPELADDDLAVERTRYAERGRDPVELWTVIGGGHTVPGGRHPGPLWGRMSHRLDAAAQSLRFFGL